MKSPLATNLLRTVVLLLCSAALLTDVRAQYAPQVPLPTVTLPLPTPLPAQIEVPSRVSVRNTSLTPLEKIDASAITGAQESFLGHAIDTQIRSISVWLLRYQIRGKNDEWRAVSARVYIPEISTASPLFVFGSGTTGIADKCAPSLENVAIENLGNYHNHMITQAAAGYVSVFPDYEGFGDPSEIQSYFISKSESAVLLGAIQSLLDFSTEEKIGIDFGNVFLAGYSQGGHAALSAAQDWEKLPSRVKLRGIIQYAGAADVGALFLESPWLAPYLSASFQAYYGEGLNPRDILQPRWLENFSRDNERLCVNQAYNFFPRDPSEMYGSVFLDAIRSQTWPSSLQSWEKIIELNTPLQDLPDVAYLSLQGATDPIVTAKAQRANTQILCKQQKNIVYKEYAGTNHFQVRRVGFSDTNMWMQSVRTGQVIETSCPKL